MLKSFADRWALVTGASSGLGAEFARQLAGLGMHLVLVARRRESMDALAAELRQQHATKCLVVPLDLTEPGAIDELTNACRDAAGPIELLVNNAGFGIVGDVDSADRDQIQRMLRLNVIAVTELIYRHLPEMLANRSGAVINMSSLAGLEPVAYMGAYAASKAYVLHLSEALAAEVRDRGVTVLAVCPGVTNTEFFNVAGVSGWLKKHAAQEPDEVVREAIRALEKRRFHVVTGWRNKLLVWIARFASRRRVVLESMRFFRPKRRDS